MVNKMKIHQIFLLFVISFAPIVGVHALPREANETPLDMISVTNTIQDMQSSLRILLSESNRQNQDLEMLKDYVGALKYGFAILQHTTNELSARSDQQHYLLHKEIAETQSCLEDFGTNLQALQQEANGSPLHMKSVTNTLQDIQSFLRILLSGSHRQNQDLEMIKYGFATLQHTTYELSARSDQQHYQLHKEIAEAQSCLEDFGTNLETFQNDTKDRLEMLQTDVTGIEQCLEVTKNDTKDRLEMLQTDVTGIEQCLEVTKNDTKDRLEMLQTDVTCLARSCSTPGYTDSNPATSCSEILQAAPQSPSGLYWIIGADSTPLYLSCDMEFLCANETEPTGWMRVVSIDMSDLNQTCPSGFNTIDTPIRRCAKDITNPGCSSTMFSVQGVEYSRVCGMAIGYQDMSTDGFGPPRRANTIDSTYVDGISLTYNQNPRQHIWTFAAGLNSNSNPGFVQNTCPCTNPQLSGPTLPPDFVGTDYFCEVGATSGVPFSFQSDNPLWDGKGCPAHSECCEFNNPPWFKKEISPPTSEDVEMRLCADQGFNDEDINFEIFQLYIQ